MPGTAKIISAALNADGGITPAHRRRIMEALATGPAAAPAVPAALDGFYTPTEAAKLCGVTLAGLLLWVRAGKMEAQRIGKRNYLIPAAAVDAMLAKRKPAPIRADALPDRTEIMRHRRKYENADLREKKNKLLRVVDRLTNENAEKFLSPEIVRKMICICSLVGIGFNDAARAISKSQETPTEEDALAVLAALLANYLHKMDAPTIDALLKFIEANTGVSGSGRK